MTLSPRELITPRILVVDDERQIHASLRLRLAENYELISCAEPRAALERVKEEPFDLCIVDLHMPGMDGLEFVEAAKQMDPGLGFVFLSGHGTEENLRRAIPLQVYDFILKPLPDRAGFEQRLPEWILRTKARRREMTLVARSGSLAQELDVAQIERDIEFTASESARDALLQSANLLTTIHALLMSATQTMDGREKQDASLRHTNRALHEARRAAEAATSITEKFFNSAYANRDDSPAILTAGFNHSLGICLRWTRAENERKQVDLLIPDTSAVVRDLTGIELLLLLIPGLGAALEITAPGTTVQVRGQDLERLDAGPRLLGARDFVWVNRRHAVHSQPGILVHIRTKGRALDHREIKSWLGGGLAERLKVPARGLLQGVSKCKGMIGFSVSPSHEHFEILLVLPT